MSHEYTAALVILIVSVLKAFKIEIASEAFTGIVTGVLAVWIAVRRFKKGDIRSRVLDTLKLVGLGKKSGEIAGGLSGG